MLLGEGYVVLCQGLPLAFDIEHGVVTNPRVTAPQKATRFTLDDAARVAVQVKNGNGTHGEVVHVRHAVATALVGQRELLALLEANTKTQSNKH